MINHEEHPDYGYDLRQARNTLKDHKDMEIDMNKNSHDWSIITLNRHKGRILQLTKQLEKFVEKVKKHGFVWNHAEERRNV